jgi:hypothetical protein
MYGSYMSVRFAWYIKLYTAGNKLTSSMIHITIGAISDRSRDYEYLLAV